MSITDIIKTQNIITITSNETLSSALAKLSTSHDAAFLFSPENKYLGVINPYYCLIKSSYPGNAKVEHCLYHAPKIHTNFSISKIAELFIESKIHYLPVFDDKEHFTGIISARHLLSQFQDLPMFNVKISELLKQKKGRLAMIDENELVTSAVNEFKITKYSKLVVIGKDLKLKGILSYYDLISYLVAPKKGQRSGDKYGLTHQKVKNFAKSYVLTLSSDKTLHEVIKMILTKKIGSVVVIDSTKHPIGIITTKDILRFFILDQQAKRIEIISKNLSQKSQQIFGNFFYHFSNWIKKIPDVTKARVFVKEEKQGGLFKVVLSLFPKRGNPQIIKQEGRDLVNVLQKIKRD
ncbi:MAG: CBS domain-containing protein [bacterium]|nr:CBS domain-containing protein [bacterium]